MLLNQLISCIPKKWNKSIKNAVNIPTMESNIIYLGSNEKLKIENINSKVFYKRFINERYTHPTNMYFWSKIFPELKNIEDKQWEIIFTLPDTILNEVKISMIQVISICCFPNFFSCIFFIPFICKAEHL